MLQTHRTKFAFALAPLLLAIIIAYVATRLYKLSRYAGLVAVGILVCAAAALIFAWVLDSDMVKNAQLSRQLDEFARKYPDRAAIKAEQRRFGWTCSHGMLPGSFPGDLREEIQVARRTPFWYRYYCKFSALVGHEVDPFGKLDFIGKFRLHNDVFVSYENLKTGTRTTSGTAAVSASEVGR